MKKYWPQFSNKDREIYFDNRIIPDFITEKIKRASNTLGSYFIVILHLISQY